MANSRSGKVMATLLGKTWEEANKDLTSLQMGRSPNAICPLTAVPAQAGSRTWQKASSKAGELGLWASSAALL